MAMGITQALKLQQGPIDALAQLPQQQLIQMAQQGRIPADVLPVILNEKAQMAQQAANMQAAQQPMPPSVIEQAMAINAQAEAQPQPGMMAAASPQAMPSSIPSAGMASAMEPGLAGLNVPEDMYGSESYAGGGIVAFQDGGSTFDRMEDVYGGSNMYGFGATPTTSTTGMPRPLTFEDYVRQATAVREAIPQSPEVEAIRKYLSDQERKVGDARLNAWTRALEAGLGIMGETSPYALANIGKGSQAAAKGYAEDVKERRKQELADMQLKLQLDQAARAEKLGAITSAERAYGTAQEIAAREKQGELDRANRLAIANIPDKTIQVANELRKADRSLSYLDSIAQASQAMAPKDTYNATRSALTAAAKAVEERMSVDPVLLGLTEKIKKGDQAAITKAKNRKDEIEKEVFKRFQVEGVDLSSGRMGSANANDPLGIR